MSDKMKVYLYKVKVMAGQDSLSAIIDDVDSLSMQKRVRGVSGYPMKVEKIERLKNENSVYLMDFCKHRSSGPGRAKEDAETQGFKLGKGEAFGEMTAALYDSDTKFIAVQYNHHGPRAGAIAEYFSSFSNDSQIIFNNVLRQDILAKIQEKQHNKRLSFTFAPGKLTEAHKQRLGIGAVLDNLQAGQYGANVAEVQITIKKQRGKSPRMQEQLPFLRTLLDIIKKDERAILGAEVDGAMTHEDTTELLNLINARVFDEQEGLVRDPATRMYSFESRCELLSKSVVSWRRQGIVTAEI